MKGTKTNLQLPERLHRQHLAHRKVTIYYILQVFNNNHCTTAPQPSLTTEYTPIQRGGHQPPATPSQSQADASFSGTTPATPTPAQAQPSSTPQPSQPSELPNDIVDDGIDTSTLPVAQAPPSHPPIEPDVTAVFDGRSILELDLGALADKPWRRPGSDVSDWFNYGFDELSWEAYCYRRRDLGDLANVLKTNVIVSFCCHIRFVCSLNLFSYRVSLLCRKTSSLHFLRIFVRWL